MNKLILTCSLLCSVIALTARAQVTSCPLFDQDNFGNASAWTSVDPIAGNGSIQITAGTIYFSNNEPSGGTCNFDLGACNGREIRVWRPLVPGALSDTSWRAECKFRITNGNGACHGLMGYTAGNIDPEGVKGSCPSWVCNGNNNSCPVFTNTNQDGIFASIIAFGNDQIPQAYNNRLFDPIAQTYDATHPLSTNNPATPPGLGWRIFGHAKHNAGPFYQAPIIAASNTTVPPIDYSRGIELPALNTDYYLRLERLNSGECKISVFSDSGFSNHIPGSPQCFKIEPEIKGLNTVQNFTHASGSFYRSMTGTISDLRVYNECRETPASCSPTPTPTPTATPTPTPTPTPTGCAQVTGETRCLPNGGYSYTFNVTNNSGGAMSQILLTPAQGSTFTLNPQLTNLSPLLQNGQSTTLTTTIGNGKPGDKICFFVSLMSEKASCCIVQVCPALPRCGVIDYPTPPPPVPRQLPRGKRRP
jgi:hypothetical protein